MFLGNIRYSNRVIGHPTCLSHLLIFLLVMIFLGKEVRQLTLRVVWSSVVLLYPCVWHFPQHTLKRGSLPLVCRSFIITSDKGTMITGRMVPATVLIKATFDNNILTLNYPGSEELQIDIGQAEKNRENMKTK